MSTSTMSSPTPAPEKPPALAPGTHITDRYRIVAELGEGGMGAVYLVEHVHMRKQFALKVLHAELSGTGEISARFEREAIAAGRIAHPNVAAATDFGKLPEGSFFLVLEYVKGETLRLAIDKGRLDPMRAIRIVHGMAQALAAAHANGVVHRDLKPENVMLVTHEGESDFVKVLDFGIAKVEIVEPPGSVTSGAQPLTRVGAVFGTPDYMSPEQALGQDVDFRTDLYSTGVILYELLAGERPFRGGAVTVLRSHVFEDVPPLAPEVTAALDPRIAAILGRLLAKQPLDRLASAYELSMEIESILRAPLAASPRMPPVARAPEPMGTMPTMMAVAGPPTALAMTPVLAPDSKRKQANDLAAAGKKKPFPVLVAALAGGLAVFLLIGIVVIVALKRAAASKASASEASSAIPAEPEAASVVLPPPPAPTPDDPDAPKSGKAASTPPPNPATKGTKKETRRTGPGGIYIPPPNKWFN
ncbi:MAG: serine/threonine-protein kinase [Polyangiaceae bacterium]